MPEEFGLLPQELEEDNTSGLVPEVGVETSTERKQIDLEAAQADGFKENVALGFQETAAAKADTLLDDELDLFMDEAQAIADEELGGLAPQVGGATSALRVLLGARAGPDSYNKSEHVEALTTGIPMMYHQDIMDEPNLGAARRQKARIELRLKEREKLAKQYGGGFGQLVGQILDIDLPLTFLSGGAFGSYKAAQLGYKSAKLAGLGSKGALRAAAITETANAGMQAAAVVGVGGKYLDPTVSGVEVGYGIAAGLGLGGVLGPVLGGTQSKRLMDDIGARVAVDHPSLNVDPNFENLPPAAVPSGPVKFDVDEAGDVIPNSASEIPNDGSLSAAGTGGSQRTPLFKLTAPDVTDPVTGKVTKGKSLDPDQPNLSPRTREITQEHAEWEVNSGHKDRIEAESDEFWGSVIKSWIPAQLATGNAFATRLWASKAPSARFLGGAIFESANGLGRGKATAAILQQTYHARIEGAFLMRQSKTWGWARQNNQTFGNTGVGISQSGKREMNRQIMLERNAREMGLSRTKDQHISDMADMYDNAAMEAYHIGKGRPDQKSIDGFENLPENRHYQGYNWDGAAIKAAIARSSHKDVVTAMAQGYRNSGMANWKDAEAVADAVITRAMKNDAAIETSTFSFMTKDGQDFIRETLEANPKVKKQEIDNIMNRLVGDRNEAKKEGFAKGKNQINLAEDIPTVDGSELKVVDLMSQSLESDWQRYSRGMSGSAALARQGITNRAQRTELFNAITTQQRVANAQIADPKMHEPVFSHKELEAMFTNFDSGATKGFGLLSSTEVETVGRGVSLAKRLTGLAWLGKMGMTQAGETAALLAQNGLATWYTRGPGVILDKELKRSKSAVIRDLEFLTGPIGHDQHIYAQHLDLDDMSGGVADGIIGSLDRSASSMSYYMQHLNGFNLVRGMQQTTAATGATDKILRSLRKELDAHADGTFDQAKADMFRRRMWNNFGLDEEDLTTLGNLIENGVIEFSPKGYVNRLHPEQWDQEFADNFSSAIMRNINQVVQRSMAGEQDAWMHTKVGSIMTHLKTFPMAAVNKQFVRNARNGSGDAMQIAMYGMGIATISQALKHGVSGSETEKSALDLAKEGFTYSNATGWIPMYWDPTMVMLGMENMAISPYAGRGPIVPPVLSWASNAQKLPGAAWNIASGDAKAADRNAIQALPYASLLGISHMLKNIGRQGNFTTRNSDKAKKRERKEAEAQAAADQQMRNNRPVVSREKYEAKIASGATVTEPPEGYTWDDLDGSTSGSFFPDGSRYEPPKFENSKSDVWSKLLQ